MYELTWILQNAFVNMGDKQNFFKSRIAAQRRSSTVEFVNINTFIDHAFWLMHSLADHVPHYHTNKLLTPDLKSTSSLIVWGLNPLLLYNKC